MTFLTHYPWRGNVRELEHVVESAMNVLDRDGTLTVEQLPAYLMVSNPSFEGAEPAAPALSLSESMALYEKKLIRDAMRACKGRIVDAAARLKIPRTTLQYKIEKYQLRDF